MLLIIGQNEGKGKALAMKLTKCRVYSAFLCYEKLINEFKNPSTLHKRRSLKRIDPTSMDYYLELYQQDAEKDTVPDEPIPQIPALVLLLPDGGETQAEAVISKLREKHPTTVVIALCNHPSAYMPYMSECDHTIFARETEAEPIISSVRERLTIRIGDPDRIILGHLRIYSDEKDAYLYGKRLYLTPKEYDVLRFLALHVGTFFSADSIMAYCFPSTFARLKSNAVTHICHINQKALRYGSQKIILSKKGVGYSVQPIKQEP